MKISVIIACYNEEAALPLLFSALKSALLPLTAASAHTFELLFIDDGSTDSTLAYIQSLPQNDFTVKYISFTRNFGKEAAILAGLRAFHGDAVCIMDADLQDPPHLIADMLAYIERGYEVVAARRIGRGGEPMYRHICSKLFCRIINRVAADIRLQDGERDYRMMRAEVAREIAGMPERSRFTKGLFSYAHYHTKTLEYRSEPRVRTHSKWTFFKLIRYAAGAVMNFSDFPLRLIALLSTLSIITALLCLFQNAMTMFAIFLSSGLILCSVGMVGAYILRIYHEVRNRPLYILRAANVEEGDDKA